MSISTKKPNQSNSDNREKISDLRNYHQITFDHIGESNAYFYPKLAYKPHGFNEVCVTFFPSELRKGVDIYTEFIDRNYEPEDPNRTLWKYHFNPHWEEEYGQIEANSDGYVRYAVPVSELSKVERPLPSKVEIVNTFEEILQSNKETTDLVKVLEKINRNLELIAKSLSK
jgi:hypothetical protein